MHFFPEISEIFAEIRGKQPEENLNKLLRNSQVKLKDK